jgi:excinuclease UvrABC nuclease subunit
MGAVTSEEYRRRVEAALGVFDGGSLRLRAALQALRERAAADLHYEEAIVHRDAIRALDRTMSGLELVRAAAAEPGVAIVEGSGDAVVVHLVRHGRLGRTLRFMRDEVSSGAFEEALRRATARVYSDTRLAEDAYDISARHLRDIFIVETYRRQHVPAEVLLDGDPGLFAGAIVTLVRRRTRVPKKLHGAPSAD